MNLENNIKDCISKELEKGIVEKVISQQLENCIKEAVKDMFSWNGCIKKAINEKIESTMIPFIENYNYSELVPKMDYVLTDLLKNLNMDNRKLLENFQALMMKEVPKKIKLTDMFKQWQKHVEEEIDKDKIEDMDYEGACIDVNMSVEDVYENNRWSHYERKIVTFTCDTDEDVNFEFMITRWKSDKERPFKLEYETIHDISSLRYLKKFDMFMMNLSQAYSEIEIDKEYDSDEVIIEYSE